ncbi:MAG: hypothetical protein J6Y00_00550 [Paludibacteraceae bacterium]|nr:hypothetical protein [Paludibacteraceae bacterium]
MKRLFLFLLLAVACHVGAQAQNYREQFEAFEQKARQDYADFTVRVLQNYAEFVKKAWESFEASMPVPMPKDDLLPPVLYEEEQKQQTEQLQQFEEQQRKGQEQTIEEEQQKEDQPRQEEDGQQQEEELQQDDEDSQIEEEELQEEEQQQQDDEEPEQQQDEGEEEQQQEKEQPQEQTQPARQIEDRPVVVEEVIEIPNSQPAPKPAPQPQPEVVPEKTVRFQLYGTEMEVRVPDEPLRLEKTGQMTIAQTIETLTKGDYTVFIEDCQKLSRQHGLTDYFYLRLVNAAARAHLKDQPNEVELLKAFVISQSGYKTRLALDENRQLLMLFGSSNIIYGKPYWTIDGTYYYADGGTNGRLQICNFAFPEEQPFTFVIASEPALTASLSRSRTLSVPNDKHLTATVSEDINLLRMLEAYPSSQYGSNPVSRWAFYANMPLSKQARETLYPQFDYLMEGLSVQEKLNLLLRWVQKALVYEYDEKVWGHDRAFFADETLYYPYADCEDRSILFSRLVRDLIGLRVALVYYPGHLATAVEAPSSVKGDHIMVNGSRFIVCDPTYIGAPVGLTMRGMDNLSAKVLVLE